MFLPSIFNSRINLNRNNIWDDFDDFFDINFSIPNIQKDLSKIVSTPTVNIHEDESSMIIDMELPGVEKKDININIQDGMLIISGEKKNVYEDKKARRKESFYGNFKRSFCLPENIKIEDISAKQENGLLKITIPKIKLIEEKPKLKIEIK